MIFVLKKLIFKNSPSISFFFLVAQFNLEFAQLDIKNGFRVGRFGRRNIYDTIIGFLVVGQ